MLPATSAAFVPYCGPAPAPGDLLTAWNLDPVLIAALLAGAGLAATRLDGAERRAALAAVAVLALAFISPLCALASALFSARVLHHLLLIAVAAPLLALAWPVRGGRNMTALAALVHTVVTWLWHAPGPYTWALSSDAAYWLMESSLLASAVWLWQGLLDRREGPAAPVAAAIATMAQMGLLGGLLLFAGTPLFLVHLSTTAPWGISPLTDQQLAGIAMAVLATPAYAGAALWQVLSLFRATPDTSAPDGTARV